MPAPSRALVISEMKFGATFWAAPRRVEVHARARNTHRRQRREHWVHPGVGAANQPVRVELPRGVQGLPISSVAAQGICVELRRHGWEGSSA